MVSTAQEIRNHLRAEGVAGAVKSVRVKVLDGGLEMVDVSLHNRADAFTVITAAVKLNGWKFAGERQSWADGVVIAGRKFDPEIGTVQMTRWVKR